MLRLAFGSNEGSEIRLRGYTVLVDREMMRVITKMALVVFWKLSPDAESPSQAWYRLMEKGTFEISRHCESLSRALMTWGG